MMHKTCLISILGTNDYVPCIYYHSDAPGHRAENIRFVQEAVVRLMTLEERQRLEEAIIFVTEEARERNWNNNGHKDHTGTLLRREGLESRLYKLGVKARVVNIFIGASEDEIWEIFQCIIPDYALQMPEESSFFELLYS